MMKLVLADREKTVLNLSTRHVTEKPSLNRISLTEKSCFHCESIYTGFANNTNKSGREMYIWMANHP